VIIPTKEEADAARARLQLGDYVPWASAGGPNACKHGVAESIACPKCDELTVRAHECGGDRRIVTGLTLTDYQRTAARTAVYPSHSILTYPLLGLAGEVGELCNKYKKVIRGDKPILEAQADLAKELGDVLWYVAAVATDLGLDLGDVARDNLDKLEDRWQRGVVKGEGDVR